MPIILYNSKTKRRLVTTANANGSYKFPNIPSGTYFFESGDVNGRFSLMGSVNVARGEDIVVENTVDDSTADSKINKFSKKRPSVLVIRDNETIGVYSQFSERNIGNASGIQRGCTKIDNYTYRVVSDIQEQKCNNEIIIPKGSQLVGFNIKVRTEEKLNPIQDVYPYNDKWQFEIKAGKNTYGEKGNVPSSFSEGGLGTNESIHEYKYCMDATRLTKNKYIKVKTKLLAQDIGDMNNPTSIVLHISQNCAEIKDFSNYQDTTLPGENTRNIRLSGILTLRGDKPVISLLTNETSDVANPYNSIKIPLRVVYVKQKNLDLIKSKLYLIYAGKRLDLYSSSDDFFASAGLIQTAENETFKDLPDSIVMINDNFTFPPVGKYVYESISDIDNDPNSKISFLLELTLKNKLSNKTIIISKNYQARNKKDVFTPLFDLRDVEPSVYIDPIKRRYNSPDRVNNIGSDGWAKKSTIEWLNISNLVVNDISSIHGARAVTSKKNRCILGHASHTDGNQLDVLYANPRKGLGDVDNKTTTDKLTVLTEGSSHDNLSKIMEGFNLPDDFSVFNFDNITYKTDGTTNCNISDPTCLGNLNGTNMGKGIRYLGQYAGKQVSTKVDNKTIDVHDRAYDDHVKYWGYTTFKDWIVTNRLLIRYSEAIAAEFFGNKVGFKSIVGLDYDSNKATLNVTIMILMKIAIV